MSPFFSFFFFISFIAQNKMNVAYFEDLRGFYLEKFFDENECKELIDSAEVGGFEYCFDKETKRHCLRRRFEDPQLAAEISDRLFDIPELKEVLHLRKDEESEDGDGAEGALRKANVGTEFRVCKYTEGHSFGVHVDLSKRVGDQRSRYTLMIYLNDDFEGGATEFLVSQIIEPLVVTRTIVPAQGAVLLFPQDADDLPHRGTEVLLGTKYILRTDLLFLTLNIRTRRRQTVAALLVLCTSFFMFLYFTRNNYNSKLVRNWFITRSHR